MDWNVVLIALGLLGAFIAYLLGATMWLSRQFSSVRALVYEKSEETLKVIVDKLEYHEKHDDERFQNIRNDVWDLRVRNAAKDGLPPLRSRDKNAG